MIIGAQLYTLRDYCKSMTELEETLKKVKAIGYTSVQLSAVCPYTGEEMAELLARVGLTADLTHYDLKKTLGDTEGTVATHKAFGCPYVGLGYPPYAFTKEGFDSMLADLRTPLEVLSAAGLKFMYHNHNPEFVKVTLSDGRCVTLFDYLCENAPESFGVTLDCYWAQAGGADPIELLYRYKGRFDCIHLKDMVFSPEDKAVRMAAVGEGNMNYRGILKAALETGVKYAFVEQDNCYGEDPFLCLERSYRNVEKLLCELKGEEK